MLPMPTTSRKEKKKMTPDYQTAAIKATETLIKYNISSAPIDPLPILKKYPGVLVLSFAEMSEDVGIERKRVVSIFGDKNQDAITTAYNTDGRTLYVVGYNQQLPLYMVQRALARELGHIVLGHDGSREDAVRTNEAKTFAHHLLCPRALIHMVQAAGIRITTEVLGNLTGCYDRCLYCMRRVPGVKVPAELNRAVRDQFKDYFYNFFDFQRSISHEDGSALADFGTFMDGYEE